MKKILSFILVIVPTAFWSGTALAEAKESKGGKAERIMTSQTLDWKYEWYLEHRKILAQPDWDPVKAKPPLDIEKAVKIAEDYAVQVDKGFSRPEVSAISLHRFLCLEINGEKEAYTKWFYHVTLESNKHVSDQPLPRTLFVIVLFDGSVVDPKRTKVESSGD